MERFQVVDSNSVKLPGSCVICGYGGDQRPFIDFGVQVRKYGRLYFCSSCFRECERVIDDALDSVSGFDSSKLVAHVLNDESHDEATKKRPGRPKGSGTRVTKPAAK